MASGNSEAALADRPCRGWIAPEGGHVACPDGATVKVLTATVLGTQFAVAGMCESCRAASDEQEREFWAARREAQALEALRLPAAMRGWTLESFPGDDLGKGAAARVVAWLAAGSRRASRRSLYLWGDVGGGKTGLAVGIAKRLAHQAAQAAPRPDDATFDREWSPPVAFVVFRDLLAAIKEGFDDPRARRESVQAYMRQPFLVLDDLGAERPTEWALEELAVLVDGRYQAGHVNVVTSNYDPDDLGARLGRDDAVVGARIASRLLDRAEIVEVARKADRRRRGRSR